MNKQIQAVVFIYEGEVVSGTIIDAMAKHLPADKANGFTFSYKEIVEMLVKAAIKKEVDVDQSCEESTPEDNAVIYIGTVMEQALKEPFDGYKFFRAVLNKIDEFKIQYSAEDNTKLMNALFILSQEDLEISKTLLKKYHFSQEKILVLKKVYNFVTSF